MPLEQGAGELGNTRHNVAADAKTLRSLHVPGHPLVLANVWDPPTARAVESAGMRAIATASAALAPANGYEDHGRLPPDVAFNALRRIADALSLPVTADLEDGYGLPPDDLVRRTVDSGACGLNLEDSDHRRNALIPMDEQAERIRAIRAAALANGADVVINARIDVQFHHRPVEEGLERARRYFEAGADCVYPIFLSDLALIREYVALGPTNILFQPGGPLLSDLVTAKVARISIGPTLFLIMLKRVLHDFA